MKHVVIVGFGTNMNNWIDIACDEFGRRDNVEVWGFNDPSHRFGLADVDRWFQLHERDYLEEYWPPWEEYTLPAFQKEKKTPIYMWEAFDDIPMCRAYPLKEVETLTARGYYHQGSMDWLLALAILEGFEKIDIVGCWLSFNSEPISARACIEYWVGVAEAKGIEVIVHEPTDLFHAFHIVKTDLRYGTDGRYRIFYDLPYGAGIPALMSASGEAARKLSRENDLADDETVEMVMAKGK